MSTMPASISRWRMPPACFMSTAPSTSFDLQVPQSPLVQDEGNRSPARRAASRTYISAGQSTTRPVLRNVHFERARRSDVLNGLCGSLGLLGRQFCEIETFLVMPVHVEARLAQKIAHAAM